MEFNEKIVGPDDIPVSFGMIQQTQLHIYTEGKSHFASRRAAT
jgi:hypothetical protein